MSKVGPSEDSSSANDTVTARFRIWGTRGSIPVSGGEYARHGGNTSCMELDIGDEVLIFDAGSGIRGLGIELLKGGPRAVHLFVTHTHWDHIQGFPFFTPAYLPGYDITIYGGYGFGKDLQSIFQGQLDSAYFPVQMDDMQADLRFVTLDTSPVAIGPCEVTYQETRHPGTTLAYKARVRGTTLCWMPDNEFLEGNTGPIEDVPADNPELETERALVNFLRGADVVVAEAQYTAEEYPAKIGWGHTSVPNGCALARLAGIRNWIVTHHDPMHDDRTLERKLFATRQLLYDVSPTTRVVNAYDGMVHDLREFTRDHAA